MKPLAALSTKGLLALAVLALCGFLAYQAAPRPCSESTRYIHATIVQQQEAAAAAAKAAVSSIKSSNDCSSRATLAAAAVVAAVPAAAGVDLTLLPRLLAGTNFSSLKSVDLLDPAIAAKQPPQTLQQLMQLHNQLFCAAELHNEPLAGTTHHTVRNRARPQAH
eukprot:GHRQ01017979.1.p1 GENE.GHRQ01017979.1~~GHRQ01017979.1.p1  ORF type:complete len:164 (+),score=52.46 GHRQ01017979.1:1379-1870(+)